MALVRYLAVDPGLTNAGIAVFTIDFITFEIKGIKTFPSTFIHAAQSNVLGIGEKLSHRFLKARFQANYLLTLTAVIKPAFIVIEAPFFSMKFPGAFRPLVELLGIYRTELYYRFPELHLVTYEPREVKKSVGAKMIGKEEVLKALVKIPEIMLFFDPSNKTEHEIDAVAVGFKHLLALRALYLKRED